MEYAMDITDEAARAFARAFETWRREGESDPSQGARLLRKRLTVNGRWRGSATDRLSWDEYQRLPAEARALAARGAHQLEAGGPRSSQGLRGLERPPEAPPQVAP